MRTWRSLVVAMLVARSAIADPVAEARVEPAHVHADGWAPGLYFEPSFMVAAGTYSPIEPYLGPYVPQNHGATLFRLALGLVARDYYQGSVPLRVHVGVTAALSGLEPSTSRQGVDAFGIETEVDRPISSLWRIGGKLGVERGDRGIDLLSIGARVHLREYAWAGVDLFRLTTPQTSAPSCSNEMVPGCATSSTGVMAGVGLEGRQGAYLSLAGLGGAAIFIAIAIASFRVPN